MGILRGMQRHWLSVVAYHLEVKSDGGNQPVLMTMEGELQFPSETRMQIWEYVDASVLNFQSIRNESRFKGYEHKASNNEILGRDTVNRKVEGLRRRGFSPGLHLTPAGGGGGKSSTNREQGMVSVGTLRASLLLPKSERRDTRAVNCHW